MSSPKDRSDYPYMNNLNMDIRLIGCESGISPMASQTTASRAEMLSSHSKQLVPILHPDFPRAYSGTEFNLGEYETSTSARDQAVQIIAVIPKYPTVRGEFYIQQNPSLTVIYIGLDDRLINYFTIDTYTKGSDGFGYYNKFKNEHLLQTGQVVDKEIQFSTSPLHKENLYCTGANLNVAYMTLDDTIEDSMLIGRSAANKMTSHDIRQITASISPTQHPLDRYGDGTEFKFMPDIGETVNDDCILCAFRDVDGDTFLADTSQAALQKPYHLHDKIYYAPPGSIVLDIDVYVPNRIGSFPKQLYTQIDKYRRGNIQYFTNIVQTYNQYKSQYGISAEFNTLVSRAIARLSIANVRHKDIPYRPKMRMTTKKGHQLDSIRITITYAVERHIASGFKVTGRDGAKGVACRIADDEDMPVDEQGVRADIVIDPASSIARQNTGQLSEQGLSRVSLFVQKYVKDAYKSGDTKKALDILYDYYNDINPNYLEMVVKPTLNTEDLRLDHLEEVIRDGIYLNTPPSLDTIGTALFNKLVEKWHVTSSPVTYYLRNKKTGERRKFTTDDPVTISSKYIYLLCKIPEVLASGVSYVNQFQTPMRAPPHMRNRYPISQNPIKFGEDEGRLMAMDLKNVIELTRIASLQSGSIVGLNTVIDTLLRSEHPTQIDRFDISNEVLVKTNMSISLFHHMMMTRGIDSLNTITTDDVETNFVNFFANVKDDDKEEGETDKNEDEEHLDTDEVFVDDDIDLDEDEDDD